MEIASLAKRVSYTLLDGYKPCLCSKTMTECLQIILGLVMATIAGGSLWCTSVPDVWVKESLDKYPNDINLPIPVCVQLVDTAQLAYTLVSAMVFMSIAFLYGASADQQIGEWNKWYYVWGVPTPVAAAAVVGCQAALAMFHVLAYLLVQNNAEAAPDNETLTAGSIAYHYANLMTGYFVHTLVYSMSIRRTARVKTNRDNDDMEQANGTTDDESSNDVYSKTRSLPAFQSCANNKKPDETDDTDRTSSASSANGDVERGEIDTMVNEPTTTRHSTLPPIETTTMTMQDEEMPDIVNDAQVYYQLRSEVPVDPITRIVPDEALPPNNGTNEQEHYQIPSEVPLVRSTTMDHDNKTHLCGLSIPWMTPAKDVVPPSSTTVSGGSNNQMMDWVQGVFWNSDRTLEQAVRRNGEPMGAGDQGVTDSTHSVAVDPPGGQERNDLTDCSSTNAEERGDDPSTQLNLEQVTDRESLEITPAMIPDVLPGSPPGGPRADNSSISTMHNMDDAITTITTTSKYPTTRSAATCQATSVINILCNPSQVSTIV
jgi:hypothetical protein